MVLVQSHNPLQHHYTKLFTAVPTSYADAVLKYGRQIMNCTAEEWQSRPIEGNAAWLLERLEQENKRLWTNITHANKQWDAYRASQDRNRRDDADYLPYDEDYRDEGLRI